ncbi:MAG: hypothetical protein ACI934_000626 [Pseudohongiellaceae bacterium]|jgi:hypothetical protein
MWLYFFLGFTPQPVTTIRRTLMQRLLISSIALSLFSMVAALPVLAQRPDRPLIPLNAYELTDYQAVDVSEAFNFPEGLGFAGVSGLDINSEKNIVALHRGEYPFLEFDAEGNFLRQFGPKEFFTFSHGLHVDEDDNLWATDAFGHLVVKFDKNGNELMRLGTQGESGIWDEAAGDHFFDQPNDLAWDSQGNLYVAQGHGRGEPRVLKFDSQGNFIRQWGSRGEAIGQFVVAHAIQIDDQDNIYVADRENFRIQIFDTDGNYLRHLQFNAMVCGLYLHDGFIYMTSGFDGEWAKVDMEGNIIGALGRPGSGNGEFGEGHLMVVDEFDNVYIGDVLNQRIQKYAKKN